MATYGPCGQILVDGEGFVPRFVSLSIQVSAGATGTVVTLTPPASQKVRLTRLASTGTDQDITVLVDGNTVVTGTLESASSAFNSYSVGTSGTILDITGNIDEVITITKTGSSFGIDYAYAFGE